MGLPAHQRAVSTLYLVHTILSSLQHQKKISVPRTDCGLIILVTFLFQKLRKLIYEKGQQIYSPGVRTQHFFCRQHYTSDQIY